VNPNIFARSQQEISDTFVQSTAHTFKNTSKIASFPQKLHFSGRKFECRGQKFSPNLVDNGLPFYLRLTLCRKYVWMQLEWQHWYGWFDGLESQPAKSLDHSLDSRSFLRSLARWREAAVMTGARLLVPQIFKGTVSQDSFLQFF
jgi:hypothetical protein